MRRTSSGPGAWSSRVICGAVATVSAVACSAGEPRRPFETDEMEQAPAPEAPQDDAPSSTPLPDPPAPPPEPPACKTAAPSNACGVVPQCGCAPTHTCDVADALGNVRCVTAGNAPMGQPCTATAGCALGLTCVGGTCHAFCDAPGEACARPGTGKCVQITTTGGAKIPNLAVCRVSCAPHDPTSCGGKTVAGTGVCYVDGEGGTDCLRGGEKLEDETCTPEDDCGPGLVCTTVTKNGVSTSSCKRWCRIGQDDCGAGKSCVGFATEVEVGGVAYGACP